MPIELLVDGSGGAPITVVLAHGAGAPMDSPFMARVARGLASDRVRVVRFEFPYMRARREGRGPPPDREPVLLATWREVLAECEPAATVIGGKSMGGRMASMLADEAQPRGLVCLGYPFHAPGRPDRPRIDHLRVMETPTLIVQGTRDPFGKPEEVASYGLSPSIRLCWVAGGDHDLRPSKGSGRTYEENLAECVDAVREFVAAIAGPAAGGAPAS